MTKDIPAFPSEYMAIPKRSGMTLRDYFAAKALQGICASRQNKLFDNSQTLANGAYVLADAMLKARHQ